MAETNKSKLSRLGSGGAVVPPPRFPPIPDEIKKRHPETAEAWSEYERQIQLFFQAQSVSK